MSRIAESLAGAALRLAELGWYVLALRPSSKRPATKHGVHDASASAFAVQRWWQADRERNIGIAAGECSGVTIVDVDDASAADELRRIAMPFGGLPQTVTSRTPRGQHFYFRYRPGLRNRARVSGLPIDVRSDGGYVVAPPSRVSSPHGYAWEASPWSTELAPMPDWLHAFLSASAPLQYAAARVSGGAPNRYGASVLQRECDALGRAPTGTRNHALNRAAFRVGTLLAPCGLDEATIVRRLVQVCEVNGLVRDDGLRAVLATIQSGLCAGRARPRRIAALDGRE